MCSPFMPRENVDRVHRLSGQLIAQSFGWDILLTPICVIDVHPCQGVVCCFGPRRPFSPLLIARV